MSTDNNDQTVAQDQAAKDVSSNHDELAGLCQSFANASSTKNLSSSSPNASLVSSRQAMYKNRGRLVVDQAERRRKELELQKQRRFNAMALARRLAEDNWTRGLGDDGDEDNEDLASVADTDETLAADEVAMDDSIESLQKRRRPGRNYRNQLMLSEWLIEVPEDFEAEFLLKLCPQGKRVLVVAARGNTRTFDRRGRCIMNFPSDLPGGCRQSKSGLTILDCIWDTSSFHVLDIMHWRDLQLYDTETALRFHWLETNMAESVPRIGVRSANNRHPFCTVSAHSCQRDKLAEFLALPPPFPLDGVLFYHRRTAYTFGSTPLVGWLKHYMLPEALGLECHPGYSVGTPADYAGRLADIEQYEATRRQMASAFNDASQRRSSSRRDQSASESTANAMVE